MRAFTFGEHPARWPAGADPQPPASVQEPDGGQGAIRRRAGKEPQDKTGE